MAKNRFLILLFLALAYLSQSAHAGQDDCSRLDSHLKLTGVISQVRSDAILVDTQAGQLTVNTMKGLGEPAVGDKLGLALDDNHVTVDVQKNDDGSVKTHRMVRGRLTNQDPDAIELATLDGTKRYLLADPPPHLGRLEEGSEVAAEINEAGKISDLHPVKLGMALLPLPQLTTGMHIKVSGTVWAIRSGLLFVKVPYGTVTAHYGSSQRGDIRVGDHLVLWVDEDDYVIDVHRPSDTGHHRIIRGKASYVDDDRKKIRISTPEGVKVFSLDEEADTSTVLHEQTPVTVEINEAGRVIDIHTDH
ncbi:MAG: hypothetical protein KGO52_14405 [Nitrospirota bacterium]|nr:hypothetical protein [Nitrospirota bacterium]